MSVSVHPLSPLTTGSKRLYEEAPEDTDSPCDRAGGKRGRYLAGSPSGRCSGPGPAFHTVPPATVAALRGLFPGMDDQTVTAVLTECGNDIDAAIRRLNQLRIETDAAAAAAQQQQPGGSRGPAAAAGRQQQAAAAPQQQQAQQDQGRQQQQQQQQQPAPPAAPAGPQTADQWVDALVCEMSQASDIPDARGRAAKVLHAFEQFVSSRGGGGGAGGSGDGGAGAGAAAAGAPQLQARLEEALRENSILKRAVQIQNARMQESASRDAELGALKQAVVQYQERLRHLELSNYSLALHLQKATGDAPVAPGHRPPDVY